MDRLCPIFTIAQAISSQGYNVDPLCSCKKEDCMFYNASQGICTISGQKPNLPKGEKP